MEALTLPKKPLSTLQLRTSTPCEVVPLVRFRWFFRAGTPNRCPKPVILGIKWTPATFRPVVTIDRKQMCASDMKLLIPPEDILLAPPPNSPVNKSTLNHEPSTINHKIVGYLVALVVKA